MTSTTLHNLMSRCSGWTHRIYYRHIPFYGCYFKVHCYARWNFVNHI